ncbi:polymorphic toxin-type HINT domain-containing protein [Ruminococcus albus]|uniref:Uncharacterized protein n=1 Tax=Ruminococcus albus (strain ATCC 27210 / DSM 20455 / JCM 14654 / NCDO 2250 / 7) TaxID=697329 RepID=E6UGD5_RUMA7|nr:polymorphic toxin-type HINT domain-containing protein [Ruminococcus albus]ADU21973.1 hypothetical protein Rumal_1467 [Ruminococcus albus 7 = DSM 20455]
MVAAGDLAVGDEIYQLDGSIAVVTGSQFEKLDVPVKVYNLEVEDFHSYFVGDVPVLVHNYGNDEHLPTYNTPGTGPLNKYDEYGNIIQTKYYDEYGRQIGWVDFTDHGYPDVHTIPHWHEVIYNVIFPDGKIINHRMDPNPPF